jgi:hypothetical protein
VNLDDQEVSVKLHRLRIAWVMALVALVALNLGTIREYPVGYLVNDLILMGCLPIGNVLAVGLLLGFRSRTSRPFLLGFELFGATALASYSIVASLFAMEVVVPYLRSVTQPLSDSFGRRPHSTAQLVALYSFATVMLGLPQLVIALVGGLLFHAYGERRAARPARS